MTDKELRRLSRAELLDILYEQQKRYEESLAENQALRQQLEEINRREKRENRSTLGEHINSKKGEEK